MLTPRQLKIDRAILAALAAVPVDLLLDEETLCADAARMVTPRATTAELDERVRYLDSHRRIAGIPTETGTSWQITASGRLWLQQNP
jgi:hypothetical protein